MDAINKTYTLLEEGEIKDGKKYDSYTNNETKGVALFRRVELGIKILSGDVFIDVQVKGVVVGDIVLSAGRSVGVCVKDASLGLYSDGTLITSRWWLRVVTLEELQKAKEMVTIKFPKCEDCQFNSDCRFQRMGTEHLCKEV